MCVIIVLCIFIIYNKTKGDNSVHICQQTICVFAQYTNICTIY